MRNTLTRLGSRLRLQMVTESGNAKATENDAAAPEEDDVPVDHIVAIRTALQAVAATHEGESLVTTHAANTLRQYVLAIEGLDSDNDRATAASNFAKSITVVMKKAVELSNSFSRDATSDILYITYFHAGSRAFTITGTPKHHVGHIRDALCLIHDEVRQLMLDLLPEHRAATVRAFDQTFSQLGPALTRSCHPGTNKLLGDAYTSLIKTLAREAQDAARAKRASGVGEEIKTTDSDSTLCPSTKEEE